MVDKLKFYKNRKIFITGHTGFKGSWMVEALLLAGANIMGYSLKAPTQPNLFELAKIKGKIKSVEGDIRDLNSLMDAMLGFEPEVVIHMAAQPIVRESYNNPVYTYETNVMGTVNLLETVRNCKSVKSVINVTTDKVYKNNEWLWGYRENEELNGFDPYSNSKSCSEIITESYKKSFFANSSVAISTVRAGNVIGGGDYAKDRILPDCIYAAINNEIIKLRNPNSIRPYQHVLEPIFAYLLIAEKQYFEAAKYEGSYNIGPNDKDCISTGDVASIFCKYWGENMIIKSVIQENQVHEANFLKLDISKAKQVLDWHPKWDVDKAIKKTVEFNKRLLQRDDVHEIVSEQILEYLEGSIC